MNISEETVVKQLNGVYSRLQKRYGASYVLGVFSYLDEENILRYEGVVIPTFDAICMNEPLILTIVDSVIVKDIRFLYDALRLGHNDLIRGLFSSHQIVTPKYEHIFNNLLFKPREKIRKSLEAEMPCEEVKLAVAKILRYAWSETSNAVKFTKQLTDTEKTALEGIVDVIGDEGYFSQEKICQATGISRLALSRLVEKIKTCGVGEVEYHGVKGTWIHFIDDMIMDIRGQDN